MKVLRLSMLMIAWMTFFTTLAQTDAYRQVHRGNRDFRAGRMDAAGERYLEVLSRQPGQARALFNLGDVSLARGATAEAKSYFKQAAHNEKNKIIKGMAYHNLGYIYQTAHDIDSAIVCYKEALRNNPHDDNARYNLALCQKLRKSGQGAASPQQKEQQGNEQQQQKSQQSKENPASQSGDNVSDESMRQLLDLARRKEQETREKLNNATPVRRGLRKNW